MERITELKEKLDKLRRLDKGLEIFGASHHGYEFNEPIPLEELNQFEDKYKVKLPKAYKAFISEIGNGGAGPFYGIHPLQRDLGKFNPENKFEFLNLDFVHKKAWNWSDKVFEKFYELRENEDGEISSFFDTIFWEQYCKDELTYGSIYIADYGCALRFLLITTGSEKGNIWFDQRADLKGINPVLNAQGTKLDFLDWYIGWLDTSINKIN